MGVATQQVWSDYPGDLPQGRVPASTQSRALHRRRFAGVLAWDYRLCSFGMPRTAFATFVSKSGAKTYRFAASRPETLETQAIHYRNRAADQPDPDQYQLPVYDHHGLPALLNVTSLLHRSVMLHAGAGRTNAGATTARSASNMPFSDCDAGTSTTSMTTSGSSLRSTAVHRIIEFGLTGVELSFYGNVPLEARAQRRERADHVSRSRQCRSIAALRPDQ